MYVRIFEKLVLGRINTDGPKKYDPILSCGAHDFFSSEAVRAFEVLVLADGSAHAFGGNAFFGEEAEDEEFEDFALSTCCKVTGSIAASWKHRREERCIFAIP